MVPIQNCLMLLVLWLFIFQFNRVLADGDGGQVVTTEPVLEPPILTPPVLILPPPPILAPPVLILPLPPVLAPIFEEPLLIAPTNHPSVSPSSFTSTTSTRLFNASSLYYYNYVGNWENEYQRTGHPRILWGDSVGNLYVDDGYHDCSILKISENGQKISLFAGKEMDGPYVAGRPATSTLLSSLEDIWGDILGNIYYIDYGNDVARIVKIDVTTSLTSPIVEDLNCPEMFWGNSNGLMYVTDDCDDSIFMIDLNYPPSQGGNMTVAVSGVNNVQGIWGDSSGTLYYSYINATLNYARVVASYPGRYLFGGGSDSYSSVVAPQDVLLSSLWGIWIDENTGNVFIAERHVVRMYDVTDRLVYRVVGVGQPGYSGDGGVASLAKLNNAEDVWGDSLGNLFIADFTNSRIRKVDSFGIIITYADLIASDGLSSTLASLSTPKGLWFDERNGNLFYYDRDYNVFRRVDKDGILYTVGGIYDNSVEGGGTVGRRNLASVSSEMEENVNVDNKLFNATALSSDIYDVWGNSLGCLYFVDNNDLKTVNEEGILKTLVSSVVSERISFLYGNSLGEIYVSDPNLHIIKSVSSTEGDDGGDGGENEPSTEPQSLAITEVIVTENNEGEASNVLLYGGNETHSGYNGDNIAATAAKLFSPYGLFVNSNGDLFIADRGNHRIRMIDYNRRIITTIAGTGLIFSTSDDLPATESNLHFPQDVTG
jgi:hypothetical protein